jgi:hypothetical protein
MGLSIDHALRDTGAFSPKRHRHGPLEQGLQESNRKKRDNQEQVPPDTAISGDFQAEPVHQEILDARAPADRAEPRHRSDIAEPDPLQRVRQIMSIKEHDMARQVESAPMPGEQPGVKTVRVHGLPEQQTFGSE